MKATVEICEEYYYDTAVFGAGPAGCAAAIESARSGAKTLLVEKNFSAGGAAVSGLVPGWCPVHEGILSGTPRRIYESAVTSLTEPCALTDEWIPIEAEGLKLVLDKELEASGVDVMYNAALVSASVSENRIGSVIVSGTNGCVSVRAGTFIDCTGNADLARFAGASWEKAENAQPATLCFYLGGVDLSEYSKEPYLHTDNPACAIYKIVADPEFPDITDPHFCIKFIYKDIAAINAGYLKNIDILNAFSFAEQMSLGRKIASQYAAGLRKYSRAFRDCRVILTAPTPGIRESARIKAAYTLTIEDYLARKKFPDAVARNDYYPDIHSSAENKSRYINATYGRGEYYEIPYRCLVSSLDNLLAAGRIIGMDAHIQGSARTIPLCLSLGAAAGAAAGLAKANNIPAARVDGGNLKKKIFNLL